jgi:peptide/nickel transport system substrate-binding protein
MKAKSILFSLILLLTFSAYAEKGFLVVSDSSGEITTLDPHKQFTEKIQTICQQIFEGLVRFDESGKIEPALAVSWKRIDDLRIRFKLRKGVKFHNGEPFNAESVRFSIARYFDPKIKFPALGFIDSISHVEIIDNYTVDIVTKHPDGLLLNRLAGLISIVPPKYIKEKGDDYFGIHPVGTGAFKFSKWIKNEKIILPANKNYWMKGYPKVKGLTFVFLPPKKRLKPLFENKVHIVTNFPGTQTKLVRKNTKTKIIKKLALRSLGFSFNSSSPILNNLKVRKALNYAINKHYLIKYDLFGNGKIISTFSMPGEEGHNPDLKPYEYDTERAKKLLEEAGYPDGFVLNMLVKETVERSAKIISFQLKKIGIKLKFDSVPGALQMNALKTKNYDIFMGDAPEPICHNYFSQSIFLFSKSPYSLWKDSKFDKMLQDMASTIDNKLRDKKAKNLDRYMYENALSIFTYQKMSVIAVVKNLNFIPYVSSMPYFFKAYFK